MDGLLYNDPTQAPSGGLFGNLLAPSNLPALSFAAALLSGKRGDDVGLKVSNYENNLMAQQNQARLNRANDLQQLNGLWQTLQFQDMARAIQDRKAGIPHVPDPALAAVQSKMQTLAGVPLLSAPSSAPPQSTMSGAPGGSSTGGYSGQVSGSLPPSIEAKSTGAPQPGLGPGQNFLGANPNYDPSLLPPQSAPPQSAAPQSAPAPAYAGNPSQPNFADLRDEADLYALMARQPQLMAQNRYKLSTPLVSHGVAFNPGTGLPIAGFVDNVPVRFDAQGNPQVIQSDIPQAIANRAGMVAGSQAAATSPYKTVTVTDASGASNPRFLPQLPGYPGGSQPAPTSTAIPPAVLAADRSGAPFVATQAPGGPVTFQQPPANASNAKADPWATMPRIQIPQGGYGQGTYAHGIAEQQSNMAKELSADLGNNAANASNRIATNNQALDVVDRADTGWLANHVSDFRNILATLGVKSAADQAATDQVLAKDLVTTALQRGKALFGSRFTQSEVGIMLSRAAPSPEMAKTAIKFLLQSDNALQGYAVQQAADFGRYYQTGGDPLQFKGWYAKAFPATDALKQVQLGKTVAANDPLVVTAPDGTLHRFPSATAAQAFRKAIGQ